MTIFHMHIPKTAGQSVNVAFSKNFEPSRVRRDLYDPHMEDINESDYDYISGHVGFCKIKDPSTEIFTVLRDPLDRFISIYNYWSFLYSHKKLGYKKHKIAFDLPIEEFANRYSDNEFIEQMFDRLIWQIAYTYKIEIRSSFYEDEYKDPFKQAMTNLESIKLVGFQENMASFVERAEKIWPIKLDLERNNVTTTKKISRDNLSAVARKRINRWIEGDIELYEAAKNKFL